MVIGGVICQESTEFMCVITGYGASSALSLPIQKLDSLKLYSVAGYPWPKSWFSLTYPFCTQLCPRVHGSL